MTNPETKAVDLERQRRVEQRGNGNGGHLGRRITEIDKRLVRIEALMEDAASKDDISKVKIWFLIGVVSAIGVAIPAALGAGYMAAKLVVLTAE